MVDKTGISEKEFEVIRCINENGDHNQRRIARQAGISLGLTNLILQRMVAKGYLKFRQLTPKKMQYILTPKGMAEKVKKSYYFTRRTISNLRDMKTRIQQIIIAEYEQGMHRFIIYGQGELATLVEIALRDLHRPDISYVMAANPEDINNDYAGTSTIIVTEEKTDNLLQNNRHIINVFDVLT